MELLSGERRDTLTDKGGEILASITQKRRGYKEKPWIFDEISVNSTLLCPPAMVY
jgi:hypothetical protein